MGQTDKYIIPLYENIAHKYVSTKSTVGMFGFTKTDKLSHLWKNSNYYDLRLSNWDINKKWEEGEKYKTIVCLRTSGFATNVLNLLLGFYNRLESGGILFIDWSLGSGHYPRDTKECSWGWTFNSKRCYGEYAQKKCFLYSSCLTDLCVQSSVFINLCQYTSLLGHYKGITDWKKQIQSEFDDYQLASTEDITNLFEVVHETNWTPLHKNGRFQLYTIQVLRKC